MKELVNILSAPEYSFTALLVFFYLFIKHYRFVGSKKFGIVAGIIILIISIWASFDANFWSIITMPDNIPIIILLVTVLFFTWFALHQAAENDKRTEVGAVPNEALPENKEKVWVWPNLVYTELFTIIAGSVFLIVWAILFKAPLEEPANPTWAPNPAKAPWYFLGLQEMLVYFDPWMAGVVLPGLIVVGLIAVPYIDTNPKGNGYYCFEDRKLAMSGFLFGWLVLWVYLIIIGTFLRGPNWTFYGPFEFWDVHKVVAANNVNLSEYFWIKWLSRPMPSNIILREIAGELAVIIYFVGTIFALGRTQLGKRLFYQLGQVRYYVLIILALSMMSLPIKMYLRWFFNLKYIVAMPEYELNL